MLVKNSKQMPRRYFGLHMVEGVAEYPGHQTTDGKPARILILENALKSMDPTFEGKPVYVGHVQKVDVDKIQEADGYVIKSFFNQADGKHWCEFIVVSDRGHEAISKGWRLSNAYRVRDSKGGGLWHAVEYMQEVTNGEYDHLAIVPDPRYDESRILTPEEFKEYNATKEQELLQLANSKKADQERKSKETSSMSLKFWKKSKIESANAEELASTVVTLKNGRHVTIGELINEAEADKPEQDGEKKENEEPAKEEKKEAPAEEKKENKEEPAKKEGEGEKKEEAPMANGEHKVKVGEETMTVNELVEKYVAATAPKKENDAKDGDPSGSKEETKEDKKQNSKSEETGEGEKKDQFAHFEALRNAANGVDSSPTIETTHDQVARGRARYGSAK